MSKSRKPKVTAYESGAESDSQSDTESERSDSSKSVTSSSNSCSRSPTQSRSKSPSETDDGLDPNKQRQRENSQDSRPESIEAMSMDYQETNDDLRKKSKFDNVEPHISETKQEQDSKEKTSIEQDPNFFSEKNGFLPGSEIIQLPAAPEAQCSQGLQKIIVEVLDRMKHKNYSMNDEKIKNNKILKNPSIYEKLIEAYGLDEFGSSFDSHIDDLKSHGYMFYDELDQAQMAEWTKKDKERKERTKIEMVTGIKRK